VELRILKRLRGELRAPSDPWKLGVNGGREGKKGTHLAVAKKVVRKAMKEKESSAFLRCT